MQRFIEMPNREYLLSGLLSISLLQNYFYPDLTILIIIASLVGVIPTLSPAISSIRRGNISIEVFNLFAVVVSFAIHEYRSTAFIVMMLSFARLLDWRTSSKTSNAIEELLKLKPSTAVKENGLNIEEIKIENVSVGDILIVKSGERVPVDGVVVFGSALFNEAPVTGESRPIAKVIGDELFSLSLNESGTIKMRATKVGKDSTVEQIVRLVENAQQNKSHSERMADKFAQIFLPVVIFIAGLAYWFTNDIRAVASVFLVACADDMAVAIPLAMTAAIGGAAKRGVIVKGGEWFDALSNVHTIIFDKTGTLTYGELSVVDATIVGGVNEDKFWQMVALGERFSEHPIGKALFHYALTKVDSPGEPTKFTLFKGTGIYAENNSESVAIGDEKIFAELGIEEDKACIDAVCAKREELRQTSFVVLLNKKFAGIITLADSPRKEATKSIQDLYTLGVRKIVMFTGDSNEVAADVSKTLGISDFEAKMTPDSKIGRLEELSKLGKIAMIGDGINDAPALARADVGIAMGKGGTAVAVEAADVVVLTDDLSRIAELVRLSRRTMSVIHFDMAIWAATNILGFALVFAGLLPPAFAAFYNFITDFFPLINSSRLFKN